MYKIFALALIVWPYLTFASPEEGEVKPVESTPQIATRPAPSAESLERLYQYAEAQLQSIESLLIQGSYGPAYERALDVMSEIKQKAGVNPIAKFREKIYVKNILSESDLKVKFENLSNFKKEELARAVANHYHGYYIHLLNLAKRARDSQ